MPGREVVLVTITQGKSDWGNDIQVGMLTTDNLDFALIVKSLLEEGGYHAKINRLPTHGEA